MKNNFSYFKLYCRFYLTKHVFISLYFVQKELYVKFQWVIWPKYFEILELAIRHYFRLITILYRLNTIDLAKLDWNNTDISSRVYGYLIFNDYNFKWVILRGCVLSHLLSLKIKYFYHSKNLRYPQLYVLELNYHFSNISSITYVDN